MRNQSIDIAKALAICGIVLGHVMRGLSAAAIADPLQGWYEEVDTGLYLVHLSVFFFVSALFLRRGVDREGSSTYLKRRIALLAWLFLAWTLIQGTIQLLSARLVNTPIEPISLVVGLVKPLGQLWFLPTLAIFTLIVVGIAPWKSRGRYLALLVAACAISLARWGVGGEWFFARDLAMFAFFGAGAIVRADRFGHWIASRVSTVFGFLGLLVYTIICWTSDPTPPPEHFAFSRVDATSVTLGVFAATGGLLGVLLGHAAIQAIGELHKIDLLHIKGPAIHKDLRAPNRQSSDADVLVRPSQTEVFTGALLEHGWRLVTSFDSGSAFAHAANYHHDDWGYVDVHRRYPGITIPAEAAFDALWTSSELTSIAQWPCPVPSVLDQALVLALHTARGEGRTKSQTDLDVAFTSQPAAFQDAVRSRAASLGAELALAAALGELDEFRDHPAHDLWLVYSRGGTRAEEWRARWKASPNLSGRARILAMLIGVNREYVAMELGHEPTRSEMRAAFWQRIRNGLGFKRRSVHLRIPE